MSWIIIIGLIALGLLLVLLEIFLLPGIISGIIGGLIVVYAIVRAYIEYGAFAGTITLFATIVVFALLMILFFQSKTWKKITLNDVIESKVNTINNNIIQVGDKGKSISRIAPMGKAFINGEYFEVTSNVNFIDENRELVIVKIDNNKVYVKEYISDEIKKNV
jgi:membrane-bound ClpP family serine protease